MNTGDWLKEVIPDDVQTEANRKTAGHLMRLVSKEAGKYPDVVGVELGGSYAKGTWLAGETDIDVFVKFGRDVPDERFRRVSREIGFDSMRDYEPGERYADHPYVEAAIDGTVVNVVPCYDVEHGEWRSAADRSPHHTRLMRERLTENQRNDVRLLKRFLKVRGIYGAQIAVQGFSGYAAEVIILHFGGFEVAVREMANITRGSIIGKSARKFDTPVAIMDPIDENRNLAAAISNRNMGLFVLGCRELAYNPEASPFDAQSSASGVGWDNVAAVKFGRGDENFEIIWGQARRAASAMARQMELGGFTIIRHKVLVDDERVCLLFLTESVRIPERVVRAGPDVLRQADAAKFAGSGGVVWVSPEMRLLRVEKRAHHTAGALLRHILRDPGRVGIPAGLHHHIRGGASVTVGGRIAQSIKEEAAELVRADEAVFYAARRAGE